MYTLKTEYAFDSAHFLTNYYGKCENLHGHRWRVIACISTAELGESGTEKDMVMDFGVFKRKVRTLCDSLDHTFLIEEGSLSEKTLTCLKEEGFSLTILPFRTTAENLAKYLFEQLEAEGLPVSSVEVDETPNNCAIYSKNMN